MTRVLNIINHNLGLEFSLKKKNLAVNLAVTLASSKNNNQKKKKKRPNPINRVNRPNDEKSIKENASISPSPSP